MASMSNSWWQNCKECPNRCTNNGDMVDKAKRDVLSEWGSELWQLPNYREAKLLKTKILFNIMKAFDELLTDWQIKVG